MSLLIQYTLIYASVLFLVALGGCFSEHSGVINLGLEGVMVMGALGGALVMKFMAGLAALPMMIMVVLGSILFGMVFSLFLAVAAVNFNADQTLVGTAMNMLATAAATVFVKALNMMEDPNNVSSTIQYIKQKKAISVQLGSFELNWFMVIAILALAASVVILYRTRFGLRLMACGEHPQAADSVGINVYKMRYAGVMISGLLGGLGGIAYITAGVSECIEVMMGTFLEPGDEVLVPGPGYPSYMQYINFFEGRTVPYRQIEEEDWRPDVDMIRKRITNRTKAMILINPNNPTGAVYSEKDIKAFGDIAAEYEIPLISDEIYDKIVFDGKFYSASKLKSDVPRIILNGFSKVNLMPGWRMGYCYFMDEAGLMDEIRVGMMKQFRARICPNVPCQAAAQASLQGPQDYIVEMNRKLKERADFTYKRLNEMPLITTRKAKGALYSFPEIDLKGTPWKSDKDFVFDLIKEEGVVFVHGSGFCEEFGQDHFRTVPVPTLEEAYDKVENFINRHVQ